MLDDARTAALNSSSVYLFVAIGGDVVELADTTSLSLVASRLAGSSPAVPTPRG